MKKHSMKMDNPMVTSVASRKNPVANYSGDKNSRLLVGQPVLGDTTTTGAYNSSGTRLNGADGNIPKGTQYSRIMSATPGTPQGIGDAVPLKTSGKAVNIMSLAPYGYGKAPGNYSDQKSKSRGKKL